VSRDDARVDVIFDCENARRRHFPIGKAQSPLLRDARVAYAHFVAVATRRETSRGTRRDTPGTRATTAARMRAPASRDEGCVEVCVV